MDFEYIVNGKRVSLPVNPNKIAVRFSESADQAIRRAAIDPKPEVGDFDDRLEVPHEKLTIIDVSQPDQPTSHPLTAAADALNADATVERVSPVFDLGSTQVVVTDRILVGFKPETGTKAVEIIQDSGGEILEADEDEYVVRINPAMSPFDAIAKLSQRAEVDYAEPDFITIGQHTPRKGDSGKTGGGLSKNALPPTQAAPGQASTPTAYRHEATSGVAEPLAAAGPDPLQRFQYALKITRAAEAWTRVTVSKNIKIAVLDEGVDVSHPDLASAIVGGYDATDEDANQQPQPWDAHGTACAGLAAAIPSNGLGIRGTGGGSSILAIRIAYSPRKDADWVSTSSGIRKAIDWAWQNGADILSNSWGGGAPSGAITNAFERARTRGRNGKGCVIVVAAGNAAGPVEFPGSLPNVLTIAASNEYDQPKTRTSRDGESWWGSCFGPEVDLAAPGVHNYTTDISGTNGYNAGGKLDNNYVADFNGTSSSTPLVAGICALVLSANPTLREAQVRQLLKQTADRVGGVVYKNGHNHQMGHGRINALRAVEMALAGSPLV
ncbi:MAG: S8 family serine peptidase [Ferruginibacter sp.]|nr:S8 family serine peptidase [Cytophagales bacterium]